jgi:hypothetical protein
MAWIYEEMIKNEEKNAVFQFGKAIVPLFYVYLHAYNVHKYTTNEEIIHSHHRCDAYIGIMQHRAQRSQPNA